MELHLLPCTLNSVLSDLAPLLIIVVLSFFILLIFSGRTSLYFVGPRFNWAVGGKGGIRVGERLRGGRSVLSVFDFSIACTEYRTKLLRFGLIQFFKFYSLVF